jgi:hypothetical protein
MHQRPAWTSTGAGQHALLDHVISASVGPGALAVKGSVAERPALAASAGRGRVHAGRYDVTSFRKTQLGSVVLTLR